MAQKHLFFSSFCSCPKLCLDSLESPGLVCVTCCLNWEYKNEFCMHLLVAFILFSFSNYGFRIQQMVVSNYGFRVQQMVVFSPFQR